MQEDPGRQTLFGTGIGMDIVINIAKYTIIAAIFSKSRI
jgi:hypothetical protein